jgi:hypothetical protein
MGRTHHSAGRSGGGFLVEICMAMGVHREPCYRNRLHVGANSVPFMTGRLQQTDAYILTSAQDIRDS